MGLHSVPFNTYILNHTHCAENEYEQHTIDKYKLLDDMMWKFGRHITLFFIM